MTKKIYTLKEFQEGKIAIHCKDQRAYNKFMQRIERAGLKSKVRKGTEHRICGDDMLFRYDDSIEELPFDYKNEGYKIIKPHEINLVEEKVKPTEKIDTKEKFENCYINLSNKELNGEVTEEAFDRLKQCFIEIGANLSKNIDRNVPKNFVYVRYTDDNIGGLYRVFTENHISSYSDNEKNKQEVSIYDIKGMVKPTAKPKYTIEDMKTKKLALSLPSQEEWEICIKWLKQNGFRWFAHEDNYVWEDYEEKTCVSVNLTQNYIGHSIINRYKKDGYTIITLEQLKMSEKVLTYDETAPISKKAWEGLEPTAEEDELIDKNDYSILEQCDGDKPTAEDKAGTWDYYTGDTLELKQEPMDMIMELSDDYPKAIVKFEGKEKAITRDDFNEDLGYAEGLDNIMLQDIRVNGGRIPDCKLKDLEKNVIKVLRKEEPEMMTLREAIIQRKKFKHNSNKYQFQNGEVRDLEEATNTNWTLSWIHILENPNEQVVIIKGAE